MNFAKQKRRRPKLDRRNAIKNIDYDAAGSPSSSSSVDFDDNFTPRGRFMNSIPISDGISSFRVDGVEGEFDRIFRYLGLSGIEDFAIPVADWEASKASSPSPSANNVTSSLFRVNIQNDLSELKSGAQMDITQLSTVSERDGYEDDELFQRSVNRNGILGLRPPKLAPPLPLPAIKDRFMDDPTSTLDLLKTLGPADDGRDLSLPSNEIVTGRIHQNQDHQDHVMERLSCSARQVSESPLGLSENENDNDNDMDSFNLTEEPGYSNSAVGSFDRSIMSWQKGDFLGRGSFGTVYEGFTDDGLFFAVKEVSLLDQGSLGRQSISQLEQEISLLSQFQHENIVQYLGTDKAKVRTNLKRKGRSSTIQSEEKWRLKCFLSENDDSKLYIFLELVTKGSLASLYKKYELRDSQVSAYTRQILNGLNYLHKRDVVHRDIKCANILVDASGSVKLADFGLAKATKLNDIKSVKGTAFWMAPEVVNQKNHGYGLPADIWSLGCTVLEMLTGQVPYSHLEGMQALFRIGKGEPPCIPKTLSGDAQDFIMKCLQVNPDDRPTASQLLVHPFVKKLPLAFPSPLTPHNFRTSF